MSFPVGGRVIFACAIVCAATTSLSAQTFLSLSPADEPQSAQPDELQTVDETGQSIDWSVLNVDPASLTGVVPDRKNITIIPTQPANSPNWKRTQNRDGSAAVTVDRKLYTLWDTKVGIDMGVAGGAYSPSPLLTPDRLMAGTSMESSGVAWAKTNAPALNLPLGWDKASLDARFDPAQDQGKLGARFGRSVALNGDLSMTMENGFSITHMRTQPTTDTTATANVFDTDPAAKLNFLATGTSIGVGSKMSTADNKWLNSLSAEQKLIGGVSVTGSVSETLEGITNKSLTAGFKRSW